MSVEFDTPANRVIAQQQPQNQFIPNPNLPNYGFLRQLSIQGRLRQFFGSQGASIGTRFLSTVPANGETLFIYSCYMSTTGGTIAMTVQWDGVNQLVTLLAGVNGLATAIYAQPYFGSFAGDGIKAFTVGYSGNVAGSKSATVLGWVENTSRIRDVPT